MSFFGVSLRNGIPLGLGTVAALSSAGASAAPSGFSVLPAAGTPTYTVTTTVLGSTGTSYSVPQTVLSSNGTSYTPI